jgi:hypothetical protein
MPTSDLLAERLKISADLRGLTPRRDVRQEFGTSLLFLLFATLGSLAKFFDLRSLALLALVVESLDSGGVQQINKAIDKRVEKVFKSLFASVGPTAAGTVGPGVA